MPCYECRHIRSNGRRCRSLAMQGSSFCWFHTTTRKRAQPSVVGEALDLPTLEDAESIQLALGDVLRGLANGKMDVRSANTLLYGLQIASTNLRKLQLHLTSEDLVIASALDPNDGEIALVQISEDYRLETEVEAEALEKKLERERKKAQKSQPAPGPSSDAASGPAQATA